MYILKKNPFGSSQDRDVAYNAGNFCVGIRLIRC